MKVVDERKGAAGVAEGGEVLEEANLHLCAGEQHALVPAKRALLLQEENARRPSRVGEAREAGKWCTSVEGIIHGDGESQIGRTEADADEIVRFVRIVAEQVGPRAGCLSVETI